MRRIERIVGSTAANTIAIANEIERYLDKHPQAADSDIGISEWWLKRQRIEEDVDAIAAALNYLLENDRIVREQVGGREIYRRSDRTPRMKS